MVNIYIKVLIAIIFALPLLIHSNEEKVYKQLNKIHANPFDDSYIFVFDGSPESFSIDKISIDKPKERLLKKMKFLPPPMHAHAGDRDTSEVTTIPAKHRQTT